MQDRNIELVARELSLKTGQVKATAQLLADGGTVPFIARYRKEATGGIDEVAITAIRDRLEELEELDKRRASIIKSLEERELLTAELRKKIEAANALPELEDIYLPFRRKRRTRAMVAREKGLEPLALAILNYTSKDPLADAAAYVSAEKGVESADDALAGARDIIAEIISEDPDVRVEMRTYWTQSSDIESVVVKGKDTEGAKFSDYFDWAEPIKNAPSHRVLAILRGENEGFLSVRIAPPLEQALQKLTRRFLKQQNACGKQIELAIADGYKRLLGPSMESEMRALLKERADNEAIRVFSQNIRELLMAPPLGSKRVMAIDPGLRTGCKIVCLDEQGALLLNDVIYLVGSSTDEAARKLVSIFEKHKMEAIAIGNGTGGRETETFVRGLIREKKLPAGTLVVMVNESGASIYSASEVAREEFPNHDVTVRGAVSIGRRLLDPLAELVKIDPKSIGVGQYQHDVNQAALKRMLNDVVVSCVNSVGVELNTASKQLLSYVSGLGPQLAANIVQTRNEKGPFTSRDQLKKVPRLGAKAYEQAAGFLRIRDARNPLDNSAVHPESYAVVDAMAKDLGCSVADLIERKELRARIDPNKYVSDKVGLPTINDILNELAKPGRDPRAPLNPVQFSADVTKPEDLKEGMRLEGVVTNVTAFGAFVDIGVHQDGLVHISQLANKFVKDPHEVVKVNQRVKVKVVSVDLDRRRIALTMKD
jgi:protein Tex